MILGVRRITSLAKALRRERDTMRSLVGKKDFDDAVFVMRDQIIPTNMTEVFDRTYGRFERMDAALKSTAAKEGGEND